MERTGKIWPMAHALSVKCSKRNKLTSELARFAAVFFATLSCLAASSLTVSCFAEVHSKNASEPIRLSAQTVSQELANSPRGAMLSMTLLDNLDDSWEPTAWYKSSPTDLANREKNKNEVAINASLKLIQYLEEVAPLESQSSEASSFQSSMTRSETTNTIAPQLAKPIDIVQIDIGIHSGLTPRNRAIEDRVFDSHPSQVAMRTWPITTRTWTAPKTRHRPLYFEEVNAERYGYTCSRIFQPAISTAHFFGTVPYLPYLMATNPPCECNYTLGHYRPGSCPPYRKHCWPFSVKGVGVEAAIAVGMIALIP